MIFIGIQWANHYAWYAAPFFLFALIALIFHHRSQTKLFRLLSHKRYQAYLFPGASSRRRLIKTFLSILGLFFFLLAFFLPQWGKKEHVVKQEGRDLLIALDISRSMLAQDLSPNRLAFTKLKIRDLLQKLDADRVGLILFSGSAFVQCPLTTDYNAFLMFLDQVDVETIASGTTSISGALEQAVQLFSRSEGRKNKLVVLFTDGEDFSPNLGSLRKKAEEENITLCALGVGTPEGAPIPLFNRRGEIIGHEKDETGAIALTKLNETLLLSMTQDLHGRYIRATYGDEDIDTLVRFVYRFEKESFGDKKISHYEERYPWFLVVTWVCFALEWVL